MLSSALFIPFLLLLACSQAYLLFRHYCIKKWSPKLLSQLLFVDSFLLTFVLCAALSEARVNMSPRWFFIWLMTAFVPWPGLVIMRCSVRSKPSLSFFQRIQAHKYEILLVILTFASRICLTDTLQKWDSSEYYYTIMRIGERFDFSLDTFITAFRLLAHPSYGFALWTSLGEYITPQNVSGVLTVSVLLTCAASVCIYKLLRNYWTKLSERKAFWGSVVCLTLPLYWAGISCVMPDYYMALFAIFMLYADCKKDNLMLLFWGAMTAFCKEVGFVLVAMFFAAKVFCLFFAGQSSFRQRFRDVFTNKAVYSGITVGALIIGYFLISRRLNAWAQSVYYNNPMSWSGSGDLLYNTFGIQADNIFTRLKEYFLINFEWLLTGGLIVSLIILAFRRICKKNRPVRFKPMPILQTVAMLAAYALFMCFYITAGSIRYNVLFSLLFTLLAYVVIAKVWNKELVIAYSCIVSLLMGVQSFYSIDVVTNTLFDTVDVGYTKLLYIAQSAHKNPGGDYYITNLQYRSMHENFNKMFAEINLQAEDTILIVGKDYAESAKNTNLTEFKGRHSDIRWDTENQQMKNSIDENQFLINTISSTQLFGWKQLPFAVRENLTTHVRTQLSGCNGRLFAYFSPLYQSEDQNALIEQLTTVFELGEMRSVETVGNILYFCELTVKPEDEWDLEPYMPVEYGTPEEIALQRFYVKFRPLSIEYDGSRDVVMPGDQIYVTIACYDENGDFINMETSPRGTILQSLVVGTGYNLPGVDGAVIGARIGDTVRVQCKVPASYRYKPDLAGQTITMDITINSITNILPEITDDLVPTVIDFPDIDSLVTAICRNTGADKAQIMESIGFDTTTEEH